MELSRRIQAAADYIRPFVKESPTVGLILGSGLGDFADTLEDRVVIPFAQIPDFPQATVEGHVGAFVLASVMENPWSPFRAVSIFTRATPSRPLPSPSGSWRSWV